MSAGETGGRCRRTKLCEGAFIIRQYHQAHERMTDDRALWDERETVSELGRRLLETGLTTGTGGNVSARNGDRVAVSPSGIPYEEVTPEMVPLVTLEGDHISGDLTSSSETPMHTRIYRNRNEVGGIVHTHSPYACTFASLDQPIPASHYLIAFAGPEIPVAGYAPPGTDELGDLAVKALGKEYNACLLKNHGVMAVGETAADALETAQMVEFCARIHYQAVSIGDPEILSDDQVDSLRNMFDTYGQQPDG